MDNQAPIAPYDEVRIDGKRRFEFFSQHLQIRRGNTFRSDFEMIVPLTEVSPHRLTFRIRHRSFWAGLWLLLGAVIGWALYVSGFGLNPSAFGSQMILAIGCSGLLTCLVTAKKIEFARFNTKSGTAAFDVARAGPEKAGFEVFVAQVAQQVERAQQPLDT